jgi:hypothetical protein
MAEAKSTPHFDLLSGGLAELLAVERLKMMGFAPVLIAAACAHSTAATILQPAQHYSTATPTPAASASGVMDAPAPHPLH